MILSKDNLPEWKAGLRRLMKERIGMDNYDETVSDEAWLETYEHDTPEEAATDEISSMEE